VGTFSAPAVDNIPVALNVDGVAAVQGWVDSPGTNHGIIIADSTASNGGDMRSSEYGTASLRPKLTIVYSMPASDTDPPTAPASLTVDAVGETTVDLSWSASTDNVAVTDYRVYRDAAIVATVAGTSFGDAGLTPDTAYSYDVTALDAAGNESAASNTVNPTTDATPDTEDPTAPSGLAVGTVGETTIDLSWTASTDNVAVTEYRVYRDAAIVATVAGTSFGDTALTSATGYNYQVTALDAAGNESAPSNAVNPTTDWRATPLFISITFHFRW